MAFDDYTEDIEENRLLKAALRRVAALRPDSRRLRSRIAESLAAFAAVTDVNYARNRVPDFGYTRLTERYRPVLELAGLVVRNVAVELQEGERPITALLFDMNQNLRRLCFSEPAPAAGTKLCRSRLLASGSCRALDEDGVLRPEPDLAWWHGSTCLFVGDAKYKQTSEGRLSDLYQLLAYCTATRLSEGLLLYAEQTRGPSAHSVRHGGPSLLVEAMDLGAPMSAIERRCDEITARVQTMAARALARTRAPSR